MYRSSLIHICLAVIQRSGLIASLLVVLAIPVSAREDSSAGLPKLAVMGDSISTGAHAAPRDKNGFGARLGHLFENERQVRVFARSSLCLLRKADLPYAATDEFRAALAWAPDIALVMLGTNDTIATKRDNWRHHEDLTQDALWMIDQLRERNPAVVVHLLGPPPFYPDQSSDPARKAGLAEREPRRQEIATTLRRVAQEQPGVFYHDLTRALTTTTDGVHPDTFGHEHLARELQQRLSFDFDEAHNAAERLGAAGVEPAVDQWNGFTRLQFALDGVDCQIVAPHQTAEGRPWVWRARFFGHQPALDLSLLDRGFHVAYCDVSNLYGSPAAVERWDRFYEFLTREVGLAKKPVLEGMSRGGLPVLFWAARNAEKVAAIYLDNPVANTLSWPGGQNGKRSDADWNRLLAVYGAEDADQLPQPTDPDVLRPIAANQVPLALVIGMTDEVTPPEENALPLAQQYESFGGRVAKWIKPESGHHPHGLHPPAPLRRFLLRACGYAINPATRATPSSEYRSGAGWGSDWHAAFAHLKSAVADSPDSRVVLLGDSITQGLTGHRDRAASPDGTRAIDRQLGAYHALSLGLSGDRTEHVLWRLQHGQLRGLKPEHIVLMIGVNNINNRHTGDETAEGTAAIVEWLRQHQPQATLHLLGCFPAGHKADDPRRAEIDRLHEAVRSMADGDRDRYHDLRSRFLNPDGTLNENMRSDAVHVSPSGQAEWMEAMASIIEAGE